MDLSLVAWLHKSPFWTFLKSKKKKSATKIPVVAIHTLDAENHHWGPEKKKKNPKTFRSIQNDFVPSCYWANSTRNLSVFVCFPSTSISLWDFLWAAFSNIADSDVISYNIRISFSLKKHKWFLKQRFRSIFVQTDQHIASSINCVEKQK